MTESLTVDHHMTADNIVQLDVTASGPCRVDWGDASAVQTVAATSSTPHTYTNDGNFRVNVVGPNGLAQSFAVVAGKPFPMWDSRKMSEHLQGPTLDAVAIGATTSRIG
jgi:hypothetical protein